MSRPDATDRIAAGWKKKRGPGFLPIRDAAGKHDHFRITRLAHRVIANVSLGQWGAVLRVSGELRTSDVDAPFRDWSLTVARLKFGASTEC